MALIERGKQPARHRAIFLSDIHLGTRGQYHQRYSRQPSTMSPSI